jgi:septal ring factor EnvC (AmiA/AmiB activator)
MSIILIRIQDPLWTDHLARLNRITTSISQHVSTLTNYSEKLSDLDTRQKSLLKDIEQAKVTLEREAHLRLNEAIPEIEEQNRTMDNMEKRVDTARLKLAHQVEMVLRMFWGSVNLVIGY